MNVLEPADARCNDSAYALAHPATCASALIIKPSRLTLCRLESVDFEVFEYVNGTEGRVTSGLVFTSSQRSVLVVGVNSGSGTALAAGSAVVTVTRTSDGKKASANVTVRSETNCCDEIAVATALVIDNSFSSSLPFGGDYNSRLDFAKAAAKLYADRILTVLGLPKDTIKVWEINETATPAPAGDLLGFLTSEPDIALAVDDIPQTDKKTDLLPLFTTVAADLLLQPATRRVLFVLTDGEHDTNTNRQAIIDAATAFRAAGGYVVVMGLRASGTLNGFDLLERIATPGYFINALHAPTAAEIAEEIPFLPDPFAELNYLKSLLCVGTCIPAGDEFAHEPSLDYSLYANWEVAAGQTHLLGPGLLDLLPGNGLYVDMAGGSPATIRTIDSFELQTGRIYKVQLSAAGNQRAPIAGQQLKVYVREDGIAAGDPNIFEQIVAPNWSQGFNQYTFTFNAIADVSVRLYVEQLYTGTAPTVGNLIDRVLFEDATTLTQLLFDDFDDENLIYVTPHCGPSAPLDAIADPDAPTASIYFDSGDPAADEVYQYAVSYVTNQGETAATRLAISGANTTADLTASVIRVNMPVTVEPRVTRKRLWRSLGNIDPDPYDENAALFLLAELDVDQVVYLDSERHEAFEDRLIEAGNDTLEAPEANTTAVTPGELGFGYSYCCTAYETVVDEGDVELIPVMTSATEPSGEVTWSNGSINPEDATVAFDNSDGSTWLVTSVSDQPWYLQYKFNDGPRRISSYRIKAHNALPVQDGMGAWTLSGSNDGVIWTVLDTQTHGPWDDLVAEVFNVSTTQAYAYYRITVTAFVGAATTASIVEWQLLSSGVVISLRDNCPACDAVPPGAQVPDPDSHGDAEGDGTGGGGGGTEPPQVFSVEKEVCVECQTDATSADSLVPILTADGVSGAPEGEASASSFFGTTNPFKAFDSDSATYWSCDAGASGFLPQWVQYKFPTAPGPIVRGYAVTVGLGPIGNLTPRDFKLQGSHDGTTWTDLDTRTDQIWFAGQQRSYSFTNETAYRRYRLYITSANVSGVEVSSGNSGVAVAEIQLFGLLPTERKCATAVGTGSSPGAAEADAIVKATAAANALLNCVRVYSATITHTAICPLGSLGDSVTKTVTKTSLVSEQDAIDQATAEAISTANAELVCTLSNNEAQITINDNDGSGLKQATPYPSVKYVDGVGLGGEVDSVTVTIHGFTHNSPDDVRIVLRGPGGILVELMRNCGGVSPSGIPPEGIEITFDDDAGGSLPDAGPLVAGTFKPTQFGVFANFPVLGVGPNLPGYYTTLAAFAGESTVGSWSLWVVDDLNIWGGSIAGWDIAINGVPIP